MEQEKTSWKDPFHFFPNDDFEKKPNYRVEYYFNLGMTISKPAIFTTDAEAIRTAKENKIDRAIGIKVSKYQDSGLVEIYTEGDTK